MKRQLLKLINEYEDLEAKEMMIISPK